MIRTDSDWAMSRLHLWTRKGFHFRGLAKYCFLRLFYLFMVDFWRILQNRANFAMLGRRVANRSPTQNTCCIHLSMLGDTSSKIHQIGRPRDLNRLTNFGMMYHAKSLFARSLETSDHAPYICVLSRLLASPSATHNIPKMRRALLNREPFISQYLLL